MDETTKILLGLKAVGKVQSAVLKMKRPFALKVSGMQGKVPKEALEEERNRTKLYWEEAFVHQQLQETAKELVKKVESCYEQMKKEQKAREKAKKKGETPKDFSILELPSYDTCAAYKAVEAANKSNAGVLDHYKKELSEIKDDGPTIVNTSNDDIIHDIARDAIDEYNTSSAEDKEKSKEWSVGIKSTCMELKSFAREQRKEKMKQKREYEQYLKQIKNGLKLVKKLGEITKAKDGKYAADDIAGWTKHENDEGKLTPERLAMIKGLK